MDLEQTIERCQSGEKEAFRELLQSVEKKALATAYLLSGSRGIAEDILQEAYIKVFRKINMLREPQTFNIWFFRILVRTGWEMTQKYSSIIPVDFTSDEGLLINNAINTDNNTFEAYETQSEVQNAINKLSNNLKTVIILYYYNDMSIEEISKVLNCLKATVKSRLFYARTVLKKHLPDYNNHEKGIKIVDEKECNANG